MHEVEFCGSLYNSCLGSFVRDLEAQRAGCRIPIKDPVFANFKLSLDAEMKRLQKQGLYKIMIKKDTS